MIAIPNVERPESCFQCDNSTCDHWGEYGYDNSADCPLIEIIPCEECIYNTDNTDGDNRGWCYKHGIDIIGFCSEGER